MGFIGIIGFIKQYYKTIGIVMLIAAFYLFTWHIKKQAENALRQQIENQNNKIVQKFQEKKDEIRNRVISDDYSIKRMREHSF